MVCGSRPGGVLEGCADHHGPLWWCPRLLKATPNERAKVEIVRFGLHWPAIDEDIELLIAARRQQADRLGEAQERAENPWPILRPSHDPVIQ